MDGYIVQQKYLSWQAYLYSLISSSIIDNVHTKHSVLLCVSVRRVAARVSARSVVCVCVCVRLRVCMNTLEHDRWQVWLVILKQNTHKAYLTWRTRMNAHTQPHAHGPPRPYSDMCRQTCCLRQINFLLLFLCFALIMSRQSEKSALRNSAGRRFCREPNACLRSADWQR